MLQRLNAASSRISSVPTAAVDESAQTFGPREWTLSTVVALIWGSSFLWIAIAIDHVSTTVVPLTRCAFGAAALALYRPARRRIERADWGRFAFLGLCWMAVPFLLYPLAEETVNTSITGMLNGGLPIVTTVVTAIFTRHMPSRTRVIAVAIGGGGIAIISLSSISGSKGADARGVLLLLIALVCYAVATNVARPMQATYGSLPTMLWIEIIGALWSLPLGIDGIRHSHFTWSAIGALLALGAIGTGAAFAIYAVLLHRAGPVRGMIGVFFTPIVGTALGITVRHDRFHVVAALGMLVVIGGAMLTSRPEPAQLPVATAPAASAHSV